MTYQEWSLIIVIACSSSNNASCDSKNDQLQPVLDGLQKAIVVNQPCTTARPHNAHRTHRPYVDALTKHFAWLPPSTALQ